MQRPPYPPPSRYTGQPYPPRPEDRKKRDHSALLLIPLGLLLFAVGVGGWWWFFRVPAFPTIPGMMFRFRSDIPVTLKSWHMHEGGLAVCNVEIRNNSKEQLTLLAGGAGLQSTTGQIHFGNAQGVPFMGSCAKCTHPALTGVLLPGGTASGDLYFPTLTEDVQPARVGVLAP